MSAAQRPFYLIAHQCNDISNIHGALQAGARGVECDVHMTKVEGDTEYHWWVYHDQVTSGTAVRLESWLEEAASVAKEFGQQFAIIYFDIKDADDPNVVGIRDLARAKLPPDLNLLFSRGDVPGSQNPFAGFGKNMRFNEGMAIDYCDDVEKVANYFTSIGVSNCWYGDGVDIYVPDIFTKVHSSVQAGVNARDIFNQVKKVHVWTLDDRDKIKDYVDMGVDAVLAETKFGGEFIPALVTTVAGDIKSRTDVRLATRSDFAFYRANMGESGVDGSPGDIAASWKGWIANYTPIDAAIMWPDGTGYFFKGDQYFIYRGDNTVPFAYSRPIVGGWPGWPSDFHPIDAALFWPPTGKAYFFKGNQYMRYNLNQYGGPEGVDQGPTTITDSNWAGLAEFMSGNPIDAAVYWPNGDAYFFVGNYYVKYASGVNKGEPEGVTGGSKPQIGNWDHWPGYVPLDGAVYWPNGMVYFFSDSSYFRYRP